MAFRCNLITVSGEGDYEDLIIKDHSSGDISNEEAAQLIYFIDENLGTENIRFYPCLLYTSSVPEALTSLEDTKLHLNILEEDILSLQMLFQYLFSTIRSCSKGRDNR